MNILIVGGAGYIGSHMTKMLAEQGHAVTVFDNLSAGHRDAVHPAARFIHADLADVSFLHATLADGFDGVIHFASSIQVGESVAKPALYYQNNLVSSLRLFDAMLATGTQNLIFSSTAAVYGNPIQTPINESHPQQPINPYGRSKLMVEQILADYDSAYGFKSVCLRYFNAAGAAPDSSIGERHNPETHLIPLVLQVASGRREKILVFGNDYDTPDGTCVRDYIHVDDLCSAHLLALQHLLTGGGSDAYNLGNGAGFSVDEVIQTAARITGYPIQQELASRRQGDPARLVADSSKAMAILGWQPKRSQIETIIEDAWRFDLTRPSSASR